METVVAIASSWTLARVEPPNVVAEPRYWPTRIARGLKDITLMTFGRPRSSSRIQDIEVSFVAVILPSYPADS